MGLYRRPGTDLWWLRYTINGKQVRESSGTDDREQAKKLLAERILANKQPDKRSVAKLLNDLITDYRINGRDVDWVTRYVNKHLMPAFGDLRADTLDTSDIRNFIAKQLDAGYANASVNRCVALLKRAFNIAELKFPKVKMLKEAPPRQGFVEGEKFWAIYPTLPEHQRPIALFAYETGCRKGEILNLKWKQIDFETGMVRLNPGETKNDDGRVVPLSELMIFLLGKLRHCSEFVFTYKGKPLKSIRTGWEDANTGILFHDLRRSGVRNMVRSGVQEAVAMKISGHKTRSIFDRYNIVDESDLRTAMNKVENTQTRFVVIKKTTPELEEFYLKKKN